MTLVNRHFVPTNSAARSERPLERRNEERRLYATNDGAVFDSLNYTK